MTEEPIEPVTTSPDDTAAPPIAAIVEALLFSTDAPLPARRVADLVEGADAGDVKQAIDELNARYEREGASFRIRGIANGFQMMTVAEFDPWVARLHKSRADSRLSQAALETLAIIAYRQPVMRADIEAIRGVAVGDVLGRLRDLNLVKIVGRAEEIGRPLLYGTTRRFLEVFGLSSLDDLPKIERTEPGTPGEKPTLKIAE